MAEAIGQVIFISGNVKAVDSAGNERVLTMDSMVFLGETIITEGVDSRILLKMDNNQSITMGRDDKLTLDQDIYDPNAQPVEENIASVKSIQDALLNDPNFDPSSLEAAAAGGSSVGDSAAEPTILSHSQADVNFDFLETVGINDGLGQNNEFLGQDTNPQLLISPQSSPVNPPNIIEPTVDPTPDPVPDPTPDPVPDPTPDPIPVPDPDPIPAPDPVPPPPPPVPVPPIGILTVTSDTQTEGNGNDLVHTVTLTRTPSTDQIFSFTLTDNTTSVADHGGPSFSNGVTYDAGTGTITVPAGVNSFTISTTVTDDALSETTEFYDLTVGGVAATGTILDDDGARVTNVTSAIETEGNGNDLVHTVTMSGASINPETYTFVLADNTTVGADHGAPTFSNGVTYDAGTGMITVPSGVTSFTVTTTVTDDTIDENSEFYDLTVDGVAATGTILDNDTASVLSITSDTQTEGNGNDLTHTVTMTGAASTDKTYAFNLSDNTTVGADHGAPTFSNGVTYDAGTGNITVPAGVTSFTVSTTVTDDANKENSEFYDITVGGKSATGTILDNDNIIVVDVTSDTETEGNGNDLVHTVTLSGSSYQAENYAFTLTDNTTTAADHGAPTFSDGVTLVGGNLVVPPGVTSFTITTTVAVDGVAEPTEFYDLSVGGVAATGTILDAGSPPEADPVTTESNRDTDDPSHFVADSGSGLTESDGSGITASDIAFFKKLDVGGGLDGDNTVDENNALPGGDPADLGGYDTETAENALTFNLVNGTAPDYGDLYLEQGGVFTQLVDGTNFNTDFGTGDNLYWVATHADVAAEVAANPTPSLTIGDNTGVSTNATSNVSSTLSYWETATNGVDIQGFGLDGNPGNLVFAAHGLGVTGSGASTGPSSQINFDGTTSESEMIIMDFNKAPVTDATVYVTHLFPEDPGGGAEVGKVRAYLDGERVQTWTFSGSDAPNSSGVKADLRPENGGYILDSHASGGAGTETWGHIELEGVVFDQLRFSAIGYNAVTGGTDSSDYFVSQIDYHEVPDVDFQYNVTDADSNTSADVLVQIEPLTDTPMPATNSLGALVDGIVEGLYYESSSDITGYTDALGRFEYQEGDITQFSIGNVLVGSIDTSNMNEDSQVFLQDLASVDRTDLNDEYLENMAVLLQSLDSDSGDNIVISQAMHDAFSDENFDLSTISEEDLIAIIEENGLQAVTEEDAMDHVADMLVEYTDLEQADFDEHTDDSEESAPLVAEADEGTPVEGSVSIIDTDEEPLLAEGFVADEPADDLAGNENGEDAPAEPLLAADVLLADDGLDDLLDFGSSDGSTEPTPADDQGTAEAGSASEEPATEVAAETPAPVEEAPAEVASFNGDSSLDNLLTDVNQNNVDV